MFTLPNIYDADITVQVYALKSEKLKGKEVQYFILYSLVLIGIRSTSYI